MKNFVVMTASSMWSTKKLTNEVEKILNQKASEGYELVSISVGVNIWWAPTAYMTFSKSEPQ
jgi:hypothetical protein